jgi:hypothetical protein
MDIDKAYKVELEKLVATVQAAKKIRAVKVSTWDHAMVQWKQEILETLYKNE